MKKNIRFVSAAAAALLAVAPVVTSVVPNNSQVVQAASGAVTLNKLPIKTVTITGSTLNSLFSENSISSSEMQQLNLNSNVSFPNGVVARDNKVTAVTALSTDGEFQQTIQFHAYVPKEVNNGASINAKLQNAGYKLEHGTYGYVVKSNGTTPVDFVTYRNVTGINEQGTPYFYDKTTNAVIENGKASINLSSVQTSTFTAQDLLNQFNQDYGYGHNAGKSQVSMETTASDIEKELVNQNIKRTSNGNFDYPSSNFHFTVTVKAENGKTASLTVTVRSDHFNVNYPTFKISGLDGNLSSDGNTLSNKLDQKNGRIVNGTTVPAGYMTSFYTNSKGEVLTAAQTAANLKKSGAITAFVSGNTSNKDTITPSIDTSAIENATQTGFYPVTVTATNPAGDTSKITLQVFVLKDAVTQNASTQWLNADTKTVTIDGNKVTENNQTLNKGEAVQTYGKVTVDGKSYTRLNNAASNTFVPTSALSDTEVSTTPASVAQTGTKYVMTNAVVYNDKGQSVGKKIYAFTDQPVYGTKTIGGKKYYRVSGTAEEYIKATNVQGEGTLRTLKHNAYIYKTSKKRATKQVLKKGESVRTYGYAHTFKNGKKYYRIEGATATKKMYVKVANFK